MLARESGGSMRHLSIVAVTLALLAAGCRGGATPTGTPTAESPAETTITPESPSPEGFVPAADCEDATVGGANVTVRLEDNVFDPPCLVVLGGQNLRLVNEGANLHNFSVEETQLDVDVETGTTESIEAIGQSVPAGTFTFFCKYHRDLGMEGDITVTAVG
jgi:plastocyanin